MAESKFTAPTRAEFVARTEAGASLVDAARALGIRASTVKGWVTRGRQEDAGPYAEFVRKVEAARRRATTEQPMTGDEFQRRLDAAVRSGSVTAMKLWAELDRARRAEDAEPEPSKIADLAERRRRTA